MSSIRPDGDYHERALARGSIRYWGAPEPAARQP
jgi:hypothetical protein